MLPISRQESCDSVITYAKLSNRNYVGAVERAERTPSIENAAELAEASGTTLSQVFSELELASHYLNGG
jgi:transcriptional regulator with XRE-family HTH domain